LIGTSGLPEQSKALKTVQKNFTNAWKEMLKVAAIDEKDRDTPLTLDILTDPTNKIVSTICTIYCQEGFVYKTLNHALRTKDQSKVQNLGAYA